MNLRKRLEKLLDNYLKQNSNSKEVKDKLTTKKGLYEEIISSLTDGKVKQNLNLIISFLDSIYENSIYSEELQSILSEENINQQELREFISIIMNDYNELVEEIEILELQIQEEQQLKTSAQRVKTNLKYNKYIDETNEDIDNIITILRNLKINGTISTQEYLLLMNELEHYNERKSVAKGSPDDKEAFISSYEEIPNIAMIGFQEVDFVEVSHNKQLKLDKYVREIIQLIEDKSEEKIIEVLNSHIDDDIEDNEYCYILVSLLNTYLDELINLYKLLLEEEVYRDKESRRDVIKDYYKVLNKYTIIGNYYNEITQLEIQEDDEKNLVDYHNQKRLIYSRSDVNITKAKILSDMSNVPYEYYEEIYSLLTKFKEGTLGNNKIKTIIVGSKSSGHIELKNDGIRIILKRVRDNVYNVLGVLIKKGNNDMNAYRIIRDRITPDISTDEKLEMQLELSRITEEELSQLVNEKARKNGR